MMFTPLPEQDTPSSSLGCREADGRFEKNPYSGKVMLDQKITAVTSPSALLRNKEENTQ